MYGSRAGVRLDTDRLVLREPEETDAFALLLYYRENEERFAPFEPDFVDDVEHYRRWVGWRRAESAAGTGRGFLAVDQAEPLALVAVVNIYRIIPGPPPSAVLGYSVDGAYEGRGYMREAAGAVTAYAFRELGLQRIEADYDPKNARSGALLERLGFIAEGYAVAHTLIRGTWRDHIRTALAAPDSNASPGECTGDRGSA